MEYGLYRTEEARRVDDRTIEVTLVKTGEDGRRVQLNVVVRGGEHRLPQWSVDQTVEIVSNGIMMKAAGGPVAK
jgi:hypothetical protein